MIRLAAFGVAVTVGAGLLATAAPCPAAGQTVARADTVAPGSARDLPYSIRGHDGITLAGTLALPASPLRAPIPVVLISAGSGPTDRNGNSPAGVSSYTYAQIAWGLASRGIAVVRFDKRGLRTGAAPLDPATLSVADFTADVKAGIEQLRRDARFSRVIALGHSEGAMHVLRAANAGAPVAGIAMVAGQGRPMAVVLREQLARQLESAALARYDAALPKYLRGEEPGPLPPGLDGLLAPRNRRYWQGIMQYDPAIEIAQTRVPVLVLQGSLDLQVTDVDAKALARACPNATLVMVPNVNHMLKPTAATDIVGQLPSYQDPGLPISPMVVPAIVKWIATLE